MPEPESQKKSTSTKTQAGMPYLRYVSPTVRQNFAPIMGRRDAAYDRATARLLMLGRETDVNTRHLLYAPLLELLNTTVEDTKRLVGMITGPDTLKREERQLSLFTMLYSGVKALQCFAELESIGMVCSNNTGTAAVQDAAGDTMRSEVRQLRETEQRMIAQLCSFFEMTKGRVAKYRDFVNHNFSPSNRERYTRSYRVYFEQYYKDTL